MRRRIVGEVTDKVVGKIDTFGRGRRGEGACGVGTGEMRAISSPCWEGGCPNIPDMVDVIVLVLVLVCV